MPLRHFRTSFFFFNDPATTEIYTLSLHDALPIYKELNGNRLRESIHDAVGDDYHYRVRCHGQESGQDRNSTPLNSTHTSISYAVFCLKHKGIRQDHVHNPHHQLVAEWGSGPRILISASRGSAQLRSEERRVGKECRSRWSPYH